MNSALTFQPDQALSTPAGILAQQPANNLFQLKSHVNDLAAMCKALADHIDHAVDIKWGEQARNLRLASGKDTGVVHFDDGDVRITADLPKKIEWNQSRLTDITRRITESGDDPKQYIEITYRVSETKFNAWPETLKSAFEPARTLKPGKPSYRLALLKE